MTESTSATGVSSVARRRTVPWPRTPEGLPSARCLAVADAMLRGDGVLGSVAVDGGWWPKACACLIRLGLESGLDEYWRRTDPAVAACRSQRAKLVILRRHVDRDLARRVAYTWATLSRFTHHHAYEAAPNAAELRLLHSDVMALLAQLDV
jgi:hypothetical protein